MNERRALDARRLRGILCWVIKRYGHLSQQASQTGDIVASLRFGDYPAVDIQIPAYRIENLSRHIGLITAIKVSAHISSLPQILAQIALVGYNSGSEVGGLEGAAEVMPLAERISVDFGVACATAFANFHLYAVDDRKIERDEITMALMMNDQPTVARIFSEALNLVPATRSPGRHSKHAISKPTHVHIPVDSERLLTATRYSRLRLAASLDGLNADEILDAIADYLHPLQPRQFPGRHARQTEYRDSDHYDVEPLIRYIEDEFAGVNPVPALSAQSEERVLSGASFSNLSSIGEPEGWSAEEMLRLVEEHFNPALIPDLVHYSDTVSGRDWQRRYDWIIRRRDGSLCCT